MITNYRPGGSRASKARLLIAILAAVLPLALVIGLVNGAAQLGVTESLQALWHLFSNNAGGQAEIIIGKIRLPRVLLAAVMGANLAICGAAMQGLFRNPLADPSLIGVTAGASLGGALAIASGGTLLEGYLGLTLISTGAFLGGVLAVLFVYRLATTPNGTSVATMLLAGIAITALAGALSSLLEFFVENAMLRRISLWKMGGLDGASYPRLLLGSGVSLALVVALPRYANALNALLLGESEARHLGIDIPHIKQALVVWVAVGVGTSVALVGSIAFVGLVVPHLVRLLIGPNHRYLLPASALAGAILLVAADTLARVALSPTELPVGIITAIVGVPFFVSLLRQRHHYGMQS